MEAEEAKKSVREMVKYLINVDDEDVVEGYAATFDDIMESYAKETAREQRDVERILCAAVNYKDQIICGYRHNDCIHIITEIYLNPRVFTDMQGFLTSKKRFVNRKEAGKIAYDAKQIIKPTDCLLSKDLY